MRRPVSLSFVLVALIAALEAGPAGAVSNRPVVTVEAGPPTGTDVTVTATINRNTKQIASCSYGVDAAPSIECGVGAPGDGGLGTRYTLALKDQAIGDHTVTVRVTLTDGGGDTGSTGFTIEAQQATLDLTKTEDGASPTDVFRFQLAGGPGDIDITQSTKPGDGNLEWANVAAGDYTLCERGMPAALHSSLEDAPYDATREPDGDGAVKVCASVTLGAGQTVSIPVDNRHALLAVAWTDTNGDHAYETGTDSLIARLVDTNGDGAVSAGDTITTAQFPRDHAATAFEPATVTTFEVDAVLIHNSGETAVSTSAGLFDWIARDGLEQYQELTLGGGSILLIDEVGPSCDRIVLDENSPSEIENPTGDATCGPGDDAFLDVQVDVP